MRVLACMLLALGHGFSCTNLSNQNDSAEIESKAASKTQAAQTRAVPVIVQYHVWYDTRYGVESDVYPTSERTEDVPGNYTWLCWDLRDYGAQAGALSPDVVKADGWRRNATTTKDSYPLIGLYDPDDPEILRWHIRLAKAAGITAFALSLYNWGNSKAEQRLREIFDKMLDIAAEENFLLAWEVWWCGEPEFYERHKGILDHPALYKIDNKPVIWIAPGDAPFDSFGSSATELSQNLTTLETTLGHDVVWIVQNGNPGIDLLQVTGHDLVPLTGDDIDSNPSYWTTFVQNVHNKGWQAGALVWAGFDEEAIRPQDPRYVSRDGGQKLINQLSAATQTNSNLVCVISWNDFGESTAIEPGLKEDFLSEPYKGDYYKDLRIVSDHTGSMFAPPALPSESSLDPLLTLKLEHPATFVGRAGLSAGADASNGVLFSLIGRYYNQDAVISQRLADTTMVVFSEDISAFYGQSTVLKLKASTNGDAGFDWAHWVRAEIQLSGATKLDLIDLAPNATWSSAVGPFAFPTSAQDGTAAYGADVVMIDGQTYSQTLSVHPDWSADGFSQGTFSDLNITCEDESFCCPGMTVERDCAMCNTQTSICSASGTWNPFGECTGPGVCEPGNTEQEDCGNGKTRERTCTQDCQWSDWDLCKPGGCIKEEICNDDIDNDCDGDVDEGCVAPPSSIYGEGCHCADNNGASLAWLPLFLLVGLLGRLSRHKIRLNK